MSNNNKIQIHIYILVIQLQHFIYVFAFYLTSYKLFTLPIGGRLSLESF